MPKEAWCRFRALTDVPTGLSRVTHFRSFESVGGGDGRPGAGREHHVACRASACEPETAVNLVATAGDPDGQVPLDLGGAPSPALDCATGDRREWSGGAAGAYCARARSRDALVAVTDAFGKSSTATRTVTVSGGLPVAKAGWSLMKARTVRETIPQSGFTLHSVDSQESEVCCYQATNAFDGNASTMWATRWNTASPVPPHEIQINLAPRTTSPAFAICRGKTGFRRQHRRSISST